MRCLASELGRLSLGSAEANAYQIKGWIRYIVVSLLITGGLVQLFAGLWAVLSRDLNELKIAREESVQRRRLSQAEAGTTNLGELNRWGFVRETAVRITSLCILPSGDKFVCATLIFLWCFSLSRLITSVILLVIRSHHIIDDFLNLLYFLFRKHKLGFYK